MKFQFKKTVALVLFSFCFHFASGQCNCPVPSQTVSETKLNGYKTNYKKKFHFNAWNTKRHSFSVDFSKEAIIKFYIENFINSRKGYSGVDVYFTNKKSSTFPGQEDIDQIGLIMMPSDNQCKTDIDGFSIINNSYNQRYGNHHNTPYAVPGDAQMFRDYTGYYKSRYIDSLPNIYTKSVHFNYSVFKELYEFLISGTYESSHKGLRFEFGIYSALNQTCGQIDADQITLFISPVKKNGSSNYSSFVNYVKMKYSNSIMEYKNIMAIFNHGELCPNNCN